VKEGGGLKRGEGEELLFVQRKGVRGKNGKKKGGEEKVGVRKEDKVDVLRKRCCKNGCKGL
jgi:hypothetical protein